MKTRIYDRIPSTLVGVSQKGGESEEKEPLFEGFKDIKLKSRENAVKNVEGFIKYCKEHAKGTNACTIMGEWGQGKTEIYNSHIKPYLESKGDYALFISASTLSNLYENESLSKITSKTPLVALRLLTNLFEGIRVESRSNTNKLIPILEKYVNPEDYVEDILKNLLNDYDGSKKIFIFIDEFEELLINTDALKKIISGIKETINGSYGPIDVNGEYEGAIHLFMSITPDARYKLEVNEETSLIFGGLGRRLVEIELEEIRKYEGLSFFKNLLDWSYAYNLPDPYPIDNFGLFNALLRISQRNLGNIIKLYTGLFNVLGKNEELEVLNYKNLLEFLESNKVYVYGAQTPCIEKEVYYKILKYLDDQQTKEMGNLCKKLFKILIGDLKPFNIDELVSLTESDESSIYRSIGLINENIKHKEKLERSIIKVVPLKEGKTIEDVFEVLNYYISTDEKINKDIIKIFNFIESVDEFEDRITFFEKNEKGNLDSRIFLPYDEADIKAFFREEINNDKAMEIRNLFNKLIDTDIYYISSEVIHNVIYPSPIPRTLDYIKNKEIRLKTWRDISRNLTDEYNNNMPDAFIYSLIESDIYELKNMDKDSNYPVIELKDDDLDAKINTMFYSVNGDVKSEDIEYVSKKLNDDLSIHQAIILYSGEFTANAKEMVSNKELDEDGKYSILGIHIHPTLSKRLVCAYKSLKLEEKIVDNNRRQLECKDIIIRELEFREKIKNWLNKQSSKGLVINQISTSAKSLREFADSLKLYINYMDEAISPEDVLNRNLEGVLKFRKYGKKSGLITSDFEDSANKVKDLSIELNENGFLSKNNNSLYMVQEHPIENRIFQIIEKERKITVEELQKYFIVREKNKKVFDDVFLNILEYKGKIQRKGKAYIPIDQEEAYESLKIEYSKYRKLVDRDAYKSFGHFYISKKRGDKLIIFNEFDDYLKNAYKNVESQRYSPDNSVLLRNMFICGKLIEQFEDDFRGAIEGASKQADKLHEDLKIKKLAVEKDFNYIVENAKKWLKLNLSEGKGSIHEYIVFIKDYNQFLEIYNKEYPKDELEILINRSQFDANEFRFDKSLKNAHYFNMKLYLLENIKNSIFEQLGIIERLINRNKTQFDNINSMQQEIKTQLSTINVDPKYKISYYAYEGVIAADLENSEGKEINEMNLKLSDIEKTSKNKVEEIRDLLKAALSLVNFIEDSLKKERSLVKSIELSKRDLKKLEETFDVEELKEKADTYKKKVLRIESEYKDTNPEELEDSDENPTFFVERWNEILKISKMEISQEWKNYTENNEEFIKNTKNVLDLIKKQPEFNELNDLIKNFEEINKKSLEETEYSASQLNEFRNEINKKLEKSIEVLFDPNEFILYNIIKSSKGRSKWVEYDKIKELALENMDENSLEKACNGLMDKNYLQRGFCLLS